ncbi:MAG: nucleotidyltransferase family protein [Bacteroidales bacterium]|nr:nucleotidyltransferase family protein [Bacteroidales bacterium]
MKAMIFAAGLGTRLRPLTDNMPKAMVPVSGKPMLQRVIENLAHYGFHDIVVNVHHFGEQIINFLTQNNNFGQNIIISDERKLLLDTGGGILAARRWLDDGEPFIVHNADILTTLDLSAMYKHHCISNADATLLVKSRQTERYLLFDSNNQLQGWINKKTGETRPEGFSGFTQNFQEFAFGGVHIISPTIFKSLENYTNEAKFSITPFYIDRCHDLKIQGYTPSDYEWFDIGRHETLTLANTFFAKMEK